MIRKLLLIALMALPVHADDDVTLHILGVAQDASYPQTKYFQPHCIPD